MQGADPITMEIFIEQVENMTSEELGVIAYNDPQEKRIDLKLFSAVTKAMNSNEQEEHLSFVESSVVFGRGRQAL